MNVSRRIPQSRAAVGGPTVCRWKPSIAACPAPPCSRIIHSHTLSILRSSYDFYTLAARTDEELFSIPSQPIVEAETLLLVQTEQDPLTVVELRALIHAACSFLGPVSERLHIIQRDDR